MDDADVLEPDLHASAQFLVTSRFWIQKVLVPIAVLIGVCGNIITVIVLTRRRMRCTTTIYLTALAVADIVYLFFVLLLSFEKYDRIHEQRFELYWRFFGISHWLCDAASSTSVWLTVSFTIERYIVVCHPMKGKVHCTEARAKNIITIVSILCLISTASTTFEYQLKVDETCASKNCSATLDINNITNTVDSFLEYESPDSSRAKRNVVDIEDPQIGVQDNCPTNSREDDNIQQQDSSIQSAALNSSECCDVIYYIGTEPTGLANNSIYTTTFYWFSSIGFGLLPLVLIATFNSFLVHAVYKSQKQRRRLTNAAENSSQSNENRITLLLISVVILFLICQTPTAVYLIYAAFNRTEDPIIMNIEKGLGNIFNFLLTLNAACNFLLYCVLSAKFRRTFRLIFCQRKGGNAGGLGAANNSAFGASIIRNNRRHLAVADSTTSFANSTARSRCNREARSRSSNYRGGHADTTTTMVSNQGNNTTRYSNLPQQMSEEGDNSDLEDCNGASTEDNHKNGQVVSGSKQIMGNGNRNEEALKTPRCIETLSFNSIPRSRPMLMRPIGKARSTDLVV